MGDNSALDLDAQLAALLRAQLPAVAGEAITAITHEVPSYAGAWGKPMLATIENAVQMALAGFLRRATSRRASDPGTPLSPTLEGAYALGRGEARSGRSVDALLAAYRIGARVAWRELSKTAVASGASASTLAGFAELVFAYIDELSAASVAGHSDEVALTQRTRERLLDRLGLVLLRGDPPEALHLAATAAEWAPPRTLTVVLIPESQARAARSGLDRRTLMVTEDLPGLRAADGFAALLVPDQDDLLRPTLVSFLAGRGAVVGPIRDWEDAAASYRRALRALPLRRETDTVDTEEHLADLILGADPESLGDLRARVLAPLAGLRPASAEKLAETLRAWLLHQGRREEVAEQLFVHPQTVRYRMGQLRELYGDRLEDPRTVLELLLALGTDSAPHRPGDSPST